MSPMIFVFIALVLALAAAGCVIAGMVYSSIPIVLGGIGLALLGKFVLYITDGYFL